MHSTLGLRVGNEISTDRVLFQFRKYAVHDAQSISRWISPTMCINVTSRLLFWRPIGRQMILGTRQLSIGTNTRACVKITNVVDERFWRTGCFFNDGNTLHAERDRYQASSANSRRCTKQVNAQTLSNFIPRLKVCVFSAPDKNIRRYFVSDSRKIRKLCAPRLISHLFYFP